MRATAAPPARGALLLLTCFLGLGGLAGLLGEGWGRGAALILLVVGGAALGRWGWRTRALALLLVGAVAALGLSLVGLPPIARLLALGLDGLGPLLKPSMMVAGTGALVDRVGPPIWAALVAIPALGLLLARLPAPRWAGCAAAVGVVLLTPPLRWPETGAAPLGLVSRLPQPAVTLGELTPRQRPSRLPTEGRWSKVLLVVLESVGAHNLQAHLTRVPDGPFAQLWARGRRLTRVVATANVSHMAQPALLTSGEYTRRLGAHLPFPKEALISWGFGWHFAAKGWSTVLASSQDERWLGVSRSSLAQPWTSRRHAVDLPAGDPARYRDACGTEKALDSATLAHLEATLAATPGPVFAYLNLQNTHYPYVNESDPAGPTHSDLRCGDFTALPAERLAEAQARYAHALDEQLDRVAALVAAHPDALVLITGDHGEHLIAGEGFAHSKHAIPEETNTFALLVGPGLDPGELSEPVSALDLLPTVAALVSPADLAALPRDLLAGTDALAPDAPRFAPTASYGLGTVEVALEDRRGRVTLTETSTTCDAPDGCAGLTATLGLWLACKTRYAADGGEASGLDPCARLARYNPRP